MRPLARWFAVASISISGFGCATAVDNTGTPNPNPQDAAADQSSDVSQDAGQDVVQPDASQDGADVNADVQADVQPDVQADVHADTSDVNVPDVVSDVPVDVPVDTAPDSNPCNGVTCDSPPAPYCSNKDHLHVASSPGTCSNGKCSYQAHDEFCAYGCDSGACKPDPCTGVTCDKPPASYCSDTSHLRVYDAKGVCTDGKCSYPHYSDQACAFGCNQNVCNQCSASTDCKSGEWCEVHTCKVCNTNERCGSTCQDCTTTTQVCSADGSTCVDCVKDTDCAASGKWCNAGTCDLCNTDAHCGGTCGACSGTTPHCESGSCACTATSCSSYNQCVSGACQLCKTDSACGTNCQPCGGATPRCFATATTSSCVACLADTDCASGWTCDKTKHVCLDPCRPPTDACANGKQNMDGCSKAKVIGRPQAAAGYKDSDDICYSNDRFNESGGCYDSGDDNAYRIYMRKGESISLSAKSGWGCGSGFWWNDNIYVGIYNAAGACGDKSCSGRIWCDTDNREVKTTFVAPKDGWFVIVVGSDSYPWDDNDQGDYDLNVTLTCNKAGCEC